MIEALDDFRDVCETWRLEVARLTNSTRIGRSTVSLWIVKYPSLSSVKMRTSGSRKTNSEATSKRRLTGWVKASPKWTGKSLHKYSRHSFQKYQINWSKIGRYVYIQELSEKIWKKNNSDKTIYPLGKDQCTSISALYEKLLFTTWVSNTRFFGVILLDFLMFTLASLRA